MTLVTANELKKKGVSVFDQIVDSDSEAVITVRGKQKYVVIDIDEYNKYLECRLDIALKEAHEDMAAGRFIKESVEDHIKRLKNEI